MRQKFVLYLVVASALDAVPAQAADDAACQDFTASIMVFVKSNASLRCAAHGPQWSPRPTEHLSWCMGATPAAVKARLDESKAYIEACKKNGGPPPLPK